MGIPLKVLIVEDSENDTLLLLDELRQGGYDPTYARVDSPEAMRQALMSDTWELVLADYNMPHFSGPAALEVLHEFDVDIPFIIVSGTVTSQQAIDMMRDGAQDFIFKQDLVRLVPATRRELREAVLRHERRQALEALQRERAFLSSAIELLPFPIIFNSPEGEVLRANQASYQFFGDLSMSSWWERQLLHPETNLPLPRDQWPMMRAARGEVVPPTEGILVMPDGRHVPVLVVAAPVYVGAQLVATVVSFTDITPLKEVDRAKNQFLAVLSHELRTPLANILGWVKEALEVPELAPEALRIIQRNAEDQQRMLENLLEVSRLLHGKLELQREQADLWQLTLDVVRAMTPEIAARHVILDLAPPAETLPVSVDIKRMKGVIGNLLENALHFTDAGGLITVRGCRDGSMAELVIHDSGQGISPEVLPRVFELFHTAPEVKQTGGGLGLGLPLARAILELHDGWITAFSAGKGQGTTVTVAVPLEEQ